MQFFQRHPMLAGQVVQAGHALLGSLQRRGIEVEVAADPLERE